MCVRDQQPTTDRDSEDSDDSDTFRDLATALEPSHAPVPRKRLSKQTPVDPATIPPAPEGVDRERE
jgi:hypothetical protein